MRTKGSFAALLGLLLVTLGMTAGSAQQPSERLLKDAMKADKLAYEFSDHELARIIQGFAIAPVRLDLRGKNVALVGLGSYIVNAQGGCNDCHTSPSYAEGGDPFLGQPEQINTERYLAGGTPFGPPDSPNTPFSRNLTPRATTGLPAGLTWQQFRRTMRTGVDLKNRPPHLPSEERDLLQVMPWPVYNKMSDRDLHAIYEFLRAIPPLPSTP
jgi:hypothetical protein